MSFRSGRLQVIDTMFVPKHDVNLEARLWGLTEQKTDAPCERWSVQQLSCGKPLPDIKCSKQQDRCVRMERLPCEFQHIPLSSIRTIEPFPRGGLPTGPKSAGAFTCGHAW